MKRNAEWVLRLCCVPAAVLVLSICAVVEIAVTVGRETWESR